ncbi:hypothetical protein RS030_71151 [Cryptosporidium xiaoi]|uniref:Uncharacterized protein n=1 Tax=Cryptosporidium xiaoi TaxID=659607 RepID=A0AAV9XTD2_9CRYT
MSNFACERTKIVVRTDKGRIEIKDYIKNVVRKKVITVLILGFILETITKLYTSQVVLCFDYNEKIVKSWLPDWGNLDNYKLRRIYTPNNYEIVNCDFVILTSGDKLYNENEWLLTNRINYAKKHEYCYLHLDCVNKAKCLYPHYWRYLGIIKIYYELIDTNNYMRGHKEKYLLYLDTDTMITNFDIKIDYYLNKAISESGRDFFLCISVDDNCDYKNYIINTGVMILSLNKLDTLLFSLEVITLQKTQSILSYVPEWSITGLNDQNIVILLLNETNRLNIDLIYEYCKKRKYLLEVGNKNELYKHDYFRNINVNENKSNIETSFIDGVNVFPNKYFNNIIRLKSDILKTNNIEFVYRDSWIVHLSGSNYMEQRYLIYKICVGITRSYIFKRVDIKNNIERECPYLLDEIISKKEIKMIYELFEHKQGFEVDQSNYIGQNVNYWMQNIKNIEHGITVLFNKYSKLTKRIFKYLSKSNAKVFTIESKRLFIGSVVQFIDNSSKFLTLFNELFILGNKNRKTIKTQVKSGINSHHIFEFFSVIFNKCPIINNNNNEICVLF